MPATNLPPLSGTVYEQIARIAQAASSPSRLALLDLLAQGERTVEVLAGLVGMSVATTSHHLQVLRRARLVDTHKSGVYVSYRLADPQVGEFCLTLRSLAESRLAEIQQITRQYLDGHGSLEPVGDDELLRRVRAGEVTLIDVRPREEYVAGHLPGAISLPMHELAKLARDLPADRDVVAYCRGPYCVMGFEAIDLLRRHGFRAHRLELGVPDWRARGWPVETGDEREAAASARPPRARRAVTRRGRN
jgi:rhodanese-related sulfurtransferase/DNA-binding transcriptional ArsR family regulator